MSGRTQTEEITYILRNKKAGYSIHKVFKPLVKMAKDSCVIEAPCHLANLSGIIRNLLYVRKHSSKSGINHMTGGPQYFLLAIPFRKNVLTIHDLVLLHNSHGLKREIFKLFWFTLPMRCAKVITCISNTVREDLLRNFNINPSKVITVYNPVDPSFRYVEKEFNADCPRILHVGTAWNKNLSRVIQALKGIVCKLVIIGDIEEKTAKELETANIDYIQMSDLTDEELRHEYEIADVISFPSIYEGFGMPIIEGQAVGRPVLTSNIDPMKEIANGSACLVNSKDTDSIHNGFMRILNDATYRNNLIENGLENIKRFSTDAIYSQYSKIYKSLQ